MSDINHQIKKLADDTVKKLNPEELKWMWGEALLMYSLSLYNEDTYFSFIKRYMDSHLEKGIVIDQSDTLAPVLAAYYLYKKTGEEKYNEVVQKAIHYILNAPKVINNMPNHLGSSFIGKFYPKSIWVDSIMMYGVFTSLYAKEQGHVELMKFAQSQPALFAHYLMDPSDHLFYHSYWTSFKHTYPKRKVFWGRGNGWVIAALPMLLDHIDDSIEFEQTKEILRKVSEAMLRTQREDGFFETVVNKVGRTYKESSVTALVAAGWLHGVRKGYLDSKFKAPAVKALQAVVETLVIKEGYLSMPSISAPTIPIPIFPYLGYKLTPRGNDWSYGLAAIFFAGKEYEWLGK